VVGCGRTAHARRDGHIALRTPVSLEAANCKRQAGGWHPAASSIAFGVSPAPALWRGKPFENIAYEPCVQVEIARLEELRLTASEERFAVELQLGRHDQVVAELDALVRQYPYRESLCGKLMLALYRSGRQAESLEVYQDARRTLIGAIGIEPGPALRELERSILCQDSALDLPQRDPDASESRRQSGRRRDRRLIWHCPANSRPNRNDRMRSIATRAKP
jgi:hypothetical protein